jgi:hypothetical protein
VSASRAVSLPAGRKIDQIELVAMAERANAHIVKVKASHLSMISQPGAVSRLILAAAQSVQRAVSGPQAQQPARRGAPKTRRATRDYARRSTASVMTMPMDIEEHILQLLKGMKVGDRPATFGDLARRFGVSHDVISRCSRHIVDAGLAEPSMVPVRGTMTLHGLLPKSSQ